MLSELKTARKVVGVKQLRKALKDGNAAKVFVAENAEKRVTDPIVALAEENSVALCRVATMSELGEACGIEVGAAVAAILK